MEELEEIREFKDRTVAVIVHKKGNKKKLMLLQKPHFLGVINKQYKNKLLGWFIAKFIREKSVT